MDHSAPYTAWPWASAWARASVSHLACMRVGAGHLTGPRVQHTRCSPFWLPSLTFLAAICWSGPRWQRPKREAGPQCPSLQLGAAGAAQLPCLQWSGPKQTAKRTPRRHPHGAGQKGGLSSQEALHTHCTYSEGLDEQGLCKHWSAGPGACWWPSLLSNPVVSRPHYPPFLLPLAETR